MQPCSRTEGRARLDQARRFLDTAELVSGEAGFTSVAAALCVLAGIAAADAACCAILGERARGADHRDALPVVERIGRDGPAMSVTLGRLLGLRDKSQYGFGSVSAEELRGARRQAGTLVGWAAAQIAETR